MWMRFTQRLADTTDFTWVWSEQWSGTDTYSWGNGKLYFFADLAHFMSRGNVNQFIFYWEWLVLMEEKTTVQFMILTTKSKTKSLCIWSAGLSLKSRKSQSEKSGRVCLVSVECAHVSPQQFMYVRSNVCACAWRNGRGWSNWNDTS